ncbi:hypothetical protein [Halomarina rubra]|uniref:Transporter n=1 Tax=Halomarina rubra TaxID=2071873 RepID=A0ABD6AWD3_9EURY|nr:hypothetical protein [Halomarina rubra]
MSQRASSRSASDRRVGSVAAGGAAAGVVAWLLGYAVTFLAAGDQVEQSLADLNSIVGFVGGSEVPTWKAISWLYLNAHMAVIRVTGLPGGSRSYDIIAESDSANAPLLYVLPPLAILLVTVAVVAIAGARDVVSGAVGGAAVVVGYFLVTGVVALLSAHSFGGSVTVAVALVPALLLAGFAYPLVCGSVGGALVGLVRS